MDEMTSIKETLRSFYRAIALFNQRFSYPGCTINEAIVLGIIARNPHINAAQICSFIAMDKSYLSRLLDRLEKRGWIVRYSLEVKSRSKPISLTEKGEEVSKDTTLILDRSIADHLDLLPPGERNEFVAEMVKINALLKKMVIVDIK